MHPLELLTDDRGVFTTTDAYTAGMDDRDIARAVRHREWRRVRRGAFVAMPTWEAASPEERHLIRAAAVHRSLGDRVAFSHVTAALLHGIAVWDVDLTRVHVTRRGRGTGRTEPDLVHHEGLCLVDDDVVRTRGALVTAPARAVLETGLLGDTERAVVPLDSALHRGLVDPVQIGNAYDAIQRWPGARHLEVAVRFADARAESPGESRTRWLFRIAGLPAPDLQVQVYDAHGALVATTDFGWKRRRVYAEFDGKVKYGRLLRPGQDAGEVVFAEKVREDAIRRETAGTVQRVIWTDLDRPRTTASRIGRALDPADSRGLAG